MTPSFSPAPAEQDVGLGTAYERVSVYRTILSWCEGGANREVAEGPVDGMAGMPGLHLLPAARRGARVTVALANAAARERVARVYARAGLGDRLTLASELPRRRFDLVVCFNALVLVPDWRAHLAHVWDRAERLALFVSHPYSYGTWIRRALRRLSGKRKSELFDHAACRPRVLRPALAALGEIEAEAWVDAPWWPDLFVPTGSTLAGALGLPVRKPRHVYAPETFPFADSERPDELRRALGRHPHFDRSRLAPLFAHHRAYLVRRR